MATEPSTDAACWTRADVSRYLNCSPKHVDRMRASGKLPYFRLGASVRFRPADVAAFAEDAVRTTGPKDIADHIADLVATAPPLTAEQRDRLAELLRPARDRRACRDGAASVLDYRPGPLPDIAP